MVSNKEKVPPEKNRIPIPPTQLAEIRSKAVINTWFLTGGDFDSKPNGYGFMLGNGNGNLFCFDVDIKKLAGTSVKPLDFYTVLKMKLEDINPELYKKLIKTTINTISGGYHFYFKLDFTYIGENHPVVVKVENQPVVEIRTTGYAATYPSPGYTLGTFTSENFYKDIQFLNEYEFFQLKDACLRVTKHFASDVKIKKATKKELKGMSPSYHYNEDTDIMSILTELFGYEPQYDGETDEQIRLRHNNNPTQKTSGIIYKLQSPPVYVEHSMSGSFSEWRGKGLTAAQIYAVSEGIDPYNTKKINSKLFSLGFGSLWKNESERVKILEDTFVEFLKENNIFYNEFNNAIYDGNSNKPIDDEFIMRFKFYCNSLNIKMNKQEAASFFDMTSSFPSKNPVVDYFVECLKEYDGKDYFSDLVNTIEVENISEIEEFFKIWLMQIPAQALQSKESRYEGLQTELVLALISFKHGTGKSTFFSRYLMRDLKEYFLPRLPEKILDQYVALSSNILVVDDEAATYNRKSTEHLKAIVSYTNIKYVRKYKNFESNVARRAIIALTSNRHEVINDSTNRRIVPMSVINMNVNKLLRNVPIKKLWGQLLMQYSIDKTQIYIDYIRIGALNVLSSPQKFTNDVADFLDTNFNYLGVKLSPKAIHNYPYNIIYSTNDLKTFIQNHYDKNVKWTDIRAAINYLGWEIKIFRPYKSDKSIRAYILGPKIKV